MLRETCCAGCQAVACAIAGAGLHDYYRARAGEGAPIDRPAARDEADLALYDEPEFQSRFVRQGAGGCETTLLVEGLRCGACVWLIEQALRAQTGVNEASVNLSSERAILRWNPEQVKLSTLLRVAKRFGYRARPFDASVREQGLRRDARVRLRKLFIAGIAMMQVMMYAVPVYVAGPEGIEAPIESLMRWASLVLTLPVVLYSASDFFAGAWREWRSLRLGMDTPVAIGIGAAFAASVAATLRGTGEVWFDTVTMFVFLLLAARHLEWLARRRASRALDALTAGAPESVERLLDAEGRTERVPAQRLVPGERFLIGMGEAVAVDARIESEGARFDQSLLTGEALPIALGPGDTVPGGAINLGHPVLVRALRPQADSTLSVITRLVERAAAGKPVIAGITERIARHFISGLLALALLVLLGWLQIDPDRAWAIAISVLVVSCPCALSLATPTVLAAAASRALTQGILLTRADTLEALTRCTDVLLDKTGTLTLGQPALVGLDVFDTRGEPTCKTDRSDSLLALAAALETGSTHPFARAIREAAQAKGLSIPGALSLQSHAGQGVEGLIDGRPWRLGSAGFAGPRDGTIESSAGLDSIVWLSCDRAPIARLRLRDPLHDSAPEVCAALRAAGLRLHLISGDRAQVVEAVAASVGISSWRAGARPEDKLDFIRALQAQGRHVLAMGDGINDAPVLAAAEASVAVGYASSLARTAAGAVLLGGRFDTVLTLHALALKARRVMTQNLLWALVYNALAIPAAALGWVSPWVAALGMSASSLLVATNALRLLGNHDRRVAQGSNPDAVTMPQAVAGQTQGAC